MLHSRCVHVQCQCPSQLIYHINSGRLIYLKALLCPGGNYLCGLLGGNELSDGRSVTGPAPRHCFSPPID